MTFGCTGKPRGAEVVDLLEKIKENRRSSGYMGYEKILVAEVERLRDMYQVHYKARERAEAKVRELEEAITKIIDCVAKVSVDIHHPESGEAWFEKRLKEQGNGR